MAAPSLKSQKRMPSSERTARASTATAALLGPSAKCKPPSPAATDEADEDVSSAYHTAPTVATATTSTTTELFHKLDGLQVKWWMTHKEEDAEEAEQSHATDGGYYGAMPNHGGGDDQSSVLSMGSFSSFRYYDVSAKSSANLNPRSHAKQRPSPRAASNSRHQTGTMNASVASVSQRGGTSIGSSFRTYHSTRAAEGDESESVFDRLYNDARAKAERLKRRQQQQLEDEDSHSVGSSSYYSFHHNPSPEADESSMATFQSQGTAGDESVYDRLYRNEKKSCHRRHRISPANITPSALERRLNYRPNFALRPKVAPKRSPRPPPSSVRSSGISPVPLQPPGASTPLVRRQRVSDIPKAAAAAAPSHERRLHRREPQSPVTTPPVRQPSLPSRTDESPPPSHPYVSCPEAPLSKSMIFSAITVQALWRGWACRVAYATQRCAAARIQQVWKRKVGQRGSSFRPLTIGSVLEVPASKETLVQELRLVAAVMVQASWRGFKRRRTFAAFQYSALSLQRVVRGHLSRCAVCRLHRERILDQQGLAVSYIQAWWRMTRCRRSYQSRRFACSMLQRVVRRYGSQCRDRKDSAATSIQASFRMYVQRVSYIRQSSAVRRIHSFYRWRLLHRRDKAAVLQWRELQTACATQLQASWKSYIAKNRFLQLRLATIRIQSLYRCFACRIQYCRSLKAVTTMAEFLRRSARSQSRRRAAGIRIQSWWRALQTNLAFSYTRNCAICIQSTFRRHREKIQVEAVATSIIQRTWRASRCRRHHLTLLSKASLIQSTWRLYRIQCKGACEDDTPSTSPREDYDKSTVDNVVRLQAHARRRLSMRLYRTVRLGFVSLQSTCRGRRSRHGFQFASWRRAAVVVQRGFRSMVSKRFTIMRSESAVTLQRVWRGCGVRREIRQKATTPQSLSVLRNDSMFLGPRATSGRNALSPSYIQSVWRETRSEYQRNWSNAVTIQTFYRRHRALLHFRILRSGDGSLQSEFLVLLPPSTGEAEQTLDAKRKWAAITIQTLGRTCLARSNYVFTVSSMTLIQAAVRGSQERRRFRFYRAQQVNATRLLQSLWRSYCLKAAFRELRAAAIVLQAWFRRCQQMRFYRALTFYVRRVQHRFRQGAISRCFQRHRLEAAVRIQAAWSARACRVTFLTSRSAAIVLQAFVRRRRLQRTRKSMQIAILVLQTATRRMIQCSQLRQQHKAAAVLQKSWRAFVACSNLHRARAAVVMLQSLVRGQRERLKYSAIQIAVKIVQARFRKCASRRVVASRRSNAAKCIQSVWRSFQARSVFTQAKAAASLVQVMIRARTQRQKMQELQVSIHIAAAVSIQTSWRAYATRSNMSRSRIAAIMIQATMRGRRDQERHKCLVSLAWVSAAVLIQTAWKAHHARSRFELRRRAILALQALARRRKHRREYVAFLSAALKLQTAYKRRAAALIRDVAATRVQKEWRGALVRSFWVHLRASATVVQAAVRGSIVRRRRMRLALATVLLQSVFRSILARRQYEAFRSTVLRMQRAWRRRRCRRTSIRFYLASRVIQRCIRRFLLASEQHKESLRVSAVTKIQGEARKRLALKSLLRLRQLRTISWNKAATRLQARWRTYSTRRDYITTRAAAVQIQSSIRRQLQRRRYKQIELSILLLQKVARRLLSRWAREGNRLNSAQTIQKFWRGAVVRCHQRHVRSCAVLVQALFRGSNQRQSFCRLRQAAGKIEIWYRSTLRRTKVKAQEQRAIESAAAYTIQFAWRRFHDARSDHGIAAVHIQAFWRGATGRVQVNQARFAWQDRRRDCVVTLQSSLRRMLASIQVRRRRRAARKLHRFGCLLLAKIRRGAHDEAARTIQEWYIVVAMRFRVRQVQSSVEMLRKILRGTLSRRPLLFALLRINAALLSPSLSAFERLPFADRRFVAELSTSWHRAHERSKWYAAVLIQSVARAFLCCAKTKHPRMNRHGGPTRKGACRRAVAVEVVETARPQAIRVQLCPVRHFQRNRAARTLQRFARWVVREAACAKMRLESELVELRAERAAYKLVRRLVEDVPSNPDDDSMAGLGWCIPRLAHRVTVAQAQLNEASRSLLEQHGEVFDCATTPSPLASPPMFRTPNATMPSPIHRKPCVHIQ